MSEFELIRLKDGRNSFHLYFKYDKCLYRKNGKYKDMQYYCCIGKNFDNEQCKVTGKLQNGIFTINSGIATHEHPTHEDRANCQKALNEIKSELNQSTDSIENILSKSYSKYVNSKII
jgi:hypothetical protein